MRKTRNIRALLIEDDVEDADIFRRYVAQIKNQEVAVVHADNEEKTWLYLSKEQFDLIFLDLNLGGGGNGISILKCLHKGNIDIPVIVITGSGDEVRAVETMKAGAYDYLSKDNLTADLLERTIRHVRKRHSLEQEQANMIQELAKLSVTDELTGLANRRELTRKLDEEVKRSARTGRPFALLMLDLDHFKQVNDKYGHQTGDKVLRQCSDALRKNLRGTDFAARYGGEEFCILLPETDLQGANILAEKFRQAIKSLPDPVPTVSIGVAFWKPKSSTKDIISRSDKAMYKAKETGRDCVVVYGGNVEENMKGK